MIPTGKAHPTTCPHCTAGRVVLLTSADPCPECNGTGRTPFGQALHDSCVALAETSSAYSRGDYISGYRWGLRHVAALVRLALSLQSS